MLKIMNIYNRQLKEFTEVLINLSHIDSIINVEAYLNEAPVGTKSVIFTHDDANMYCTNTVAELNTIINGH